MSPLQRAFGLNGCAEQSVIQETLDACSEANVAEIHRAMVTIYQTHSRGAHHDYDRAFLLLDIDLTGQPCGRKAEFATKGDFAHQRNRRGRQVGRVVASRYHEIVCDRLYPGNIVLHTALPDLLKDAEATLGLDAAKRKRTILRIDAGGGTGEDIQRALAMGYQIHVKDYSTARAERLAESVTDWIVDPHDANRQIGYVPVPSPYLRSVTRIAVRHRTEKGGWKAGVIVSSLTKEEVLEEARLPEALRSHPQAALLAYVYFYDQRGGGCETEIKGDKQGLGMTKRNKKRFEAQQVLTALGVLAHNVVIWAKAWIAPHAPVVSKYGIKRLIRDLLTISGAVEVAPDGGIRRIVLNPHSRLARQCLYAFQSLLASLSVDVILGET